MATIDELKMAATTVQNATANSENTAQRVGKLFNDILSCFAVMLNEASATQNGYMTSAMWSKLNELKNYDDAELRKLITDGLAGKVSVQEGKGLSTEDFTEQLKNKLSNLIEITQEQISAWNAKSDFDGDYNSLQNKPAIPTNNASLENGAGYLKSVDAQQTYADKDMLAQTNADVVDIIAQMDAITKELNQMIAGNTKLIVTVSPNIFFEGVSTEVKVKAQLVGAKGKITIGGKVSPGESSELTITDSITNTKKYKATAVVKGQIINSNEAVATATKPYFVGAGNAYTDVYNVEVCKYGPSFSAKGTYQFEVLQGQKIYIIVPNSISIHGVTFVDGGFGLPVEISPTETLEGYKIYVSAERKEGSYNIKIE